MWSSVPAPVSDTRAWLGLQFCPKSTHFCCDCWEEVQSPLSATAMTPQAITDGMETLWILTGHVVAQAHQRSHFINFSESQYYNISRYFLQSSSLVHTPHSHHGNAPEEGGEISSYVISLGSYHSLFHDLRHDQIGLSQTPYLYQHLSTYSTST